MISEICYEQIQENYWFGCYGDFKVVMIKDNGWVNATKLCKDGGKKIKNWFANDGTKELMTTLNSEILRQQASDNTQLVSNTWGDTAAGIPAAVSKYMLFGLKFQSVSGGVYDK